MDITWIILLVPLLVPAWVALAFLCYGRKKRREMDEADRAFRDSEGNHAYYDRKLLRRRKTRPS